MLNLLVVCGKVPLASLYVSLLYEPDLLGAYVTDLKTLLWHLRVLQLRVSNSSIQEEKPDLS